MLTITERHEAAVLAGAAWLKAAAGPGKSTG